MTVKLSPAAIMRDYRSGQSMAAIGRVYRCSQQTIRRQLRAMGEPTLANGRPPSVAGGERPVQTAIDHDVEHPAGRAEQSARKEGLEAS